MISRNNDKKSNGYFDHIPEEPLQKIADNLSIEDLKNLSQTNKTLHKIVKQKMLKHQVAKHKMVKKAKNSNPSNNQYTSSSQSNSYLDTNANCRPNIYPETDNYFDYLPNEILQKIAENLDFNDLARLSQTNRSFYTIVNGVQLEEYNNARFYQVSPHLSAINRLKKRSHRIVPENQNQFFKRLAFAATMLSMLSGVIEYFISRNEENTTEHVTVSILATAGVCTLAILFFALYAGEKLAHFAKQRNQHKLELASIKWRNMQENVETNDVEVKNDDQHLRINVLDVEDAIDAEQDEEHLPNVPSVFDLEAQNTQNVSSLEVAQEDEDDEEKDSIELSPEIEEKRPLIRK